MLSRKARLAPNPGGVSLEVGRTESARRDHGNAFDLVRLVLAALVVYTHAHLLGGFGTEGFMSLVRSQTLAGALAVLGFFGISGFLVTQSFVARNDWRVFVKSRLLRILPGLYLALILTAFVFAPAIASLNPLSAEWHWANAATFVFRNMFVRVGEWHVAGVVTGLPYEGSINGALWSLFPELVCYGLVLALGVVGSLQARRANVLIFALLVSSCHFALVLFPERENLAPTLLSLSGWSSYVTAFFVGVVAFLYRTELGVGGGQALWWLGIVAVLLKFGGWALFAPIALPLALIHGAHACRANLPADLSYGIYVLHFPILHLAAAVGLNEWGFSWYFVAALAVTLLCASFSWFLVEKPALKLKPGRRAEAAGQPTPDRPFGNALALKSVLPPAKQDSACLPPT